MYFEIESHIMYITVRRYTDHQTQFYTQLNKQTTYKPVLVTTKIHI